jgi:anthranilate synthase component 2
MTKVLMIDNYDSFTFNLVQILENVQGCEVEVVRNDKFSLEKVEEYAKIILSPGPGLPSEAGLMQDVVKTFSSTKSILGVCLGHQCIAEVFGGELYNLEIPRHGKVSTIEVLDSQEVLFQGLPEKVVVGRYHSWAVRKESLPSCFTISSVADDGVIMSLRHKEYNVCGVQFHPESILTPHGITMLCNWISEEEL